MLVCTTVHNDTIKLIDFNGGDLTELWSYEDLKTKVMSVDTVNKEKSIWFSGERVYGKLDVEY